ncbi:MAG: single-stranded DNA-binding protein [Cytophagales bacterium]|nr:single-stranded DNA-binding protein [Cytophagales bacterium]
MSGVNKVILVGRLGKDPEVRNFENGGMITNFPLATSETYKDKTTNERKEITEWHNIVMRRGLADIAAKYLHKGDQVYIEGKIRTRSWEKEGVTRYITEIVADEMTMLGSRQGGGNAGGSSPAYNQPAAGDDMKSNDNATDDLPF